MAAKKSPLGSAFESGFQLPKLEEEVLEFWRTNDVFEKSLKSRKGKRTFVFYEGPPGANGKPGIHHMIPRVFKDIVLRYKTMKGFYVPRKSGWDTHGLPVEIEAEKQLGLKSKKEIEKYGIERFNETCRNLVFKYEEDWKKFTERIGFWLDLKNPYVTCANDYIESLWWIIKKISDEGLLYKGYKVVPWCSRCGTSLSSHELALGYKETEDTSVYVKFKLKPKQKIGSFVTDDNTYILSWTTTPWTLPGNVALAVGEDIDYALVHSGTEKFILAQARIEEVVKGAEKTDFIWKGRDLLGLEYVPLFDVPELKTQTSYKIYAASFVTTTDGTGVVHTAVMYGEDDYNLGLAAGLPQHHTVDETGKFKEEVAGLAGLYVKAKETEEKIFEYLREKGFLLQTQPYVHEYPFCWRCQTALLYYARSSWFVAATKVRNKMIQNNKKINWIPEHLKNGRFGEWLKEIKDWNFSRERYWGTPLPVWVCSGCKHWEVVGSVDELKKKALTANQFFFIRHGESRHNIEKITGPAADTPEYTSHLTDKGIRDVGRTAAALAKKGIDLIIASPLTRTKETAEIVSKATGAPVIFKEELIDINPGVYQGKKPGEVSKSFSSVMERFSRPIPEGESWNQVRSRVVSVFREINRDYSGKRILIVSHADPLWLLKSALEGHSDMEALELPTPSTGKEYPISWNGIPLSPEGKMDLHRPYVDDVVFECPKCHSEMKRVKEVVDVWYDSGAMPFAQWHYPFQNKAFIDRKTMFPADYICEAVDQTRGWFYTLLAVSTLLGYEAPYKNVISLGLIHDKFGQKMSKSKGNVVDPWTMLAKYGTDAVRWYFFTMNPPGEPKNFDELELAKTFRRFHLILFNSFVFYRTYADSKAKIKPGLSNNILDKWILARLAQTVSEVTDLLESYDIREAALRIEGLVDDLSRWYIRRSRRRLQKPDSQSDFQQASATLGHVLREITRLIAPFLPFFAEALYHNLSGKSLSVHLADWPKASAKGYDKKLVSAMSQVRQIASDALAQRAASQIKVRQPLQSLIVSRDRRKDGITESLLAILKDEVNVKEVVFDPKAKFPEGAQIKLDTAITPELKEEGVVRDLVRSIQELRQKGGYKPKDKIALLLALPEPDASIAERNEKLIKKEVNAEIVEYKKSDKFEAELQTETEGRSVWMGVRRV